MPYLRASRYRPRAALGFTPDEEKEVLARGGKVDEMLEILRKQEQIRNIVAAGAVIGMLLTLAKFGELVSEMRHRRRERAS